MFPELDLCRTDHAQPLITAGEELDGVYHDPSDRGVQLYMFQLYRYRHYQDCQEVLQSYFQPYFICDPTLYSPWVEIKG